MGSQKRQLFVPGPSTVRQKRQLSVSLPSASVSFSCYPFSLTRFGATESGAFAKKDHAGSATDLSAKSPQERGQETMGQLSMVVPSVSAVFRFPFCRFTVCRFWHYARSVPFPAFPFAVLADTPFQQWCFSFRGPRYDGQPMHLHQHSRFIKGGCSGNRV